MSIRKELNDLIFLGAIKETIDIGGHKWSLQTLTSEEQLEATNSTASYEMLSRMYALKIQILSRSLKAVDDIILKDLNETIEFVNKLQPVIINKLYDEYEKMQKKQDESLDNIDEIKNS